MPTPPPTDLPSRERQAEEDFVAQWRDADDPDGLDIAVEAAIEARRPMLAARLVGLLPEHDDEEPAIRRARSAATMLLRSGTAPDPLLLEEFLLEWRRSRKSFMDRARRRQRTRAGQPRPRQPRRR